MHFLVHWEWISALIFGFLVSATDPVSVVATFNDAGVYDRLRVPVESESLLNDGTVAVGVADRLLQSGLLHPQTISSTRLRIDEPFRNDWLNDPEHYSGWITRCTIWVAT